MNEETKQDGHEVFAQFSDNSSEIVHLEDLGADEEEHSDWRQPGRFQLIKAASR